MMLEDRVPTTGSIGTGDVKGMKVKSLGTSNARLTNATRSFKLDCVFTCFQD